MRIPALLAVLALALHAAPPPAKTPAARNVRVPLSLASADPEAAALKSAELQVSTDAGGDARVVRLRSPKDDLLILVVLDLVGDMSLVEPARNALADQVRTLPRNAWVTLLRAQDGLQVLLDPTPDRDKVSGALASMPVSGKAGLLDTVEAAAQLADSIAAKAAVRVAVLYVTDSDVRNYREDFTNPVINSSDYRDLSRRFPEGLIREKISKLTDTLGRYQTPVFILHLWYSSERLNEAYQAGLMQIASATGGSALFCRSRAEIADNVQRVMSSLQSQYSVLVQIPPRTPSVVTISVQSERPLTYRSRYVLR